MWTGHPYPGWLYGWLVPPLDPEGSRPMSLEFLGTVMGILFLGIWLLVGHILTTDHHR